MIIIMKVVFSNFEARFILIFNVKAKNSFNIEN